MAKKLGPVQNRCLRLVAGAYRATSATTIEVEVDVPPLDLHLDERLRSYARRVHHTGAEAHRVAACSLIRSWTSRTETGPQTATQRWLQGYADAEPGQDHVREKWENRRMAELGPEPEGGRWGVTGLPDKNILKLHANLRKAESSVLIQLRTGKVGLAKFPHKRQVPGYDLPIC